MPIRDLCWYAFLIKLMESQQGTPQSRKACNTSKSSKYKTISDETTSKAATSEANIKNKRRHKRKLQKLTSQ